MVMLVIMVMGTAAFLVSSLSSSALKTVRQETTAAALAQAKEALIGYAITYGDAYPGEVHGYLPCPDMANGNTEGMAETTNCGLKNISQIGRLPWKKLGLDILRDGNSECLWYAVSGTYKNMPKTDLMNWDTLGLLEILDASGATIAQNVVAVIFAPGVVLSNQNRAADGTSPICGGNYTTANYLDNDTVHNINNTDIATGKFIQSHEDRDANGNIILTVNDQMMFVTKQDIWNAVQKRTDFQPTSPNNPLKLLTQRVAECLAYFGTKNTLLTLPNPLNKSLPWPAPLSLTDYADNVKYNDKNGLFGGRVPYKVNTARNTSSNSISNEFLLQSDGANCPGWASIYPWWDNWKDHLFYALGQEFKPSSGSTSACGTCLNINGSGDYAAVVMFSGPKLSGQTRADKSVVADYLEGFNASNVVGPANGNEDYQTAIASSTFNDILYCIKEDLSVVPCP